VFRSDDISRAGELAAREALKAELARGSAPVTLSREPPQHSVHTSRVMVPAVPQPELPPPSPEELERQQALAKGMVIVSSSSGDGDPRLKKETAEQRAAREAAERAAINEARRLTILQATRKAEQGTLREQGEQMTGTVADALARLRGVAEEMERQAESDEMVFKAFRDKSLEDAVLKSSVHLDWPHIQELVAAQVKLGHALVRQQVNNFKMDILDIVQTGLNVLRSEVRSELMVGFEADGRNDLNLTQAVLQAGKNATAPAPKMTQLPLDKIRALGPRSGDDGLKELDAALESLLPSAQVRGALIDRVRAASAEHMKNPSPATLEMLTSLQNELLDVLARARKRANEARSVPGSDGISVTAQLPAAQSAPLDVMMRLEALLGKIAHRENQVHANKVLRRMQGDSKRLKNAAARDAARKQDKKSKNKLGKTNAEGGVQPKEVALTAP
jgi:hypothetical protein